MGDLEENGVASFSLLFYVHVSYTGSGCGCRYFPWSGQTVLIFPLVMNQLQQVLPGYKIMQDGVPTLRWHEEYSLLQESTLWLPTQPPSAQPVPIVPRSRSSLSPLQPAGDPPAPHLFKHVKSSLCTTPQPRSWSWLCSGAPQQWSLPLPAPHPSFLGQLDNQVLKNPFYRPLTAVIKCWDSQWSLTHFFGLFSLCFSGPVQCWVELDMWELI